MADNEVLRTIRIRGVPDGLDNLTSQLQRAEQAYSGVGSAAATAGTATETSARKLNTTERAYRSLTERLDSTARVYRQLQQDTRTLSGAFDAGFMGKGVEAAARFNSKLLQIRQNLQDVGGRMATGNVGLDSAFGIGTSSKSARDSASAFETELEALDDIASERAKLSAQAFWTSFDQQFAGSGSSARLSASAFSGLLDELDEGERIAGLKAKAAGDEYWRAFNERFAASGKSASGSASVFQEMFAEQDRQAQTLQKLRQQYDPLGVAQDRYASAIDETNKLLAAGQISESQHLTITTNAQKVLEDTTKAYNGAFVAQGKYTSGTGLARHELINLSRQLQDVGVSLASGQSPLTVLIQQGTQIGDIFASSRASVSSFFAQAARGVAGFAASGLGLLTGGVLVGAGAIASAYKYAESQRAVEIALLGVGRASGQSVASINRVAEAAAKGGEISRSAARDIASIFAGTGRIDSSLITPNLLDTATRGYGNITGQSQRDAAQALAQALASPTAGAAELEKRLGTLGDAQRQFIINAELSGNRLGAQKALLDAFNPTLQEAANKTNLFARAWEAVSKAVSDTSEQIGKALTGPSLDERIANLREAIQNRQRYGYGPVDPSQMQAELDPLLREQRSRNEARTYRQSQEQSAELSTRAGDTLRSLFGDETRLQTLQNQKRVLDETLGDSSALAKLGPLAGKVSEGVERLNSSIDNFETQAQKIQKDYELQVQQTDAYTLGQKAAVEAERARIEAIRAGRGELQAGVEAEQARTRVIVEANRQLRDTARDLKDAGSLIGLSPYQRSLRENANTSRRERETLTMSGDAAKGGYRNPFGGTTPTVGVLNGSLSRDQLLDLIEQKESGGRNVQNYRYDATHTAQGYFQITNSTWRDAARMAGIDLGQYPNAMSAPYADQRKAASALIDARGVSPWAPYNPGLRAALAGQGSAGANDNSTARDANTVKEAYEGWNTPLANANRQLEANTELLNRQRETMFGSTAQVAEASEKQRLLNEYTAQGIPITASLAAGIDDYAKRFGGLAAAQEQVQTLNNVLKETQDIGASALKGFISDLRSGKSGAEAFANALNRIADKVLDSLIDGLFGKGTIGNVFGQGGGLFGALGKSIFGFDQGGYTGPGGKYDVAGFVHRDEFVFSKEATQRLGAANLDRLHRGVLKGYDGGGLVTPSSAYAMPAPYIHQPPAPSNSNQPVQVALAVDVRGATGNQEVQQMVATGVAAGMAQVQKQIGRNISTIAVQSNQRFAQRS